MNIQKTLFVGIALLLSPLLGSAFLPCGTSAPGVLNVGFLPQNLPYSTWDSNTNSAIGFDPLLISEAAKLLGYDTVNFIGYGDDNEGLDALAAGEIDVYANSALNLATVSPYSTIGIVTDISALSVADGNPYGWQVDLGCCELALQLEAALSELVNNGTYAKLLQLIRLNDLVGPDGLILGLPLVVSPSGILQEPFDFASSELGTIPTTCAQFGPNFAVDLPETNCISAYLQENCSPATTFTGATGRNVA